MDKNMQYSLLYFISVLKKKKQIQCIQGNPGEKANWWEKPMETELLTGRI